VPRFAANISTLFTEVPFLERPAAAAAAGFRGFECQFPYHHAAEDLAAASAGLAVVLINAPPGDFAAGERGLAALPGRESEFRDALEVGIAYASAVGCKQMHVMAGIVSDREAALSTYLGNIAYAAERCTQSGILVLIEAVSSIDGYLLARPDQAVEVLRRVQHKSLALQYDIFHAQRTQGNIAAFIESHLDLIRHVQVAGVPDRHEPDRLGELNWGFIFDLLDAHGYGGWIGAEYTPRAGTLAGLAWGRDWGLGAAQSTGKGR
jgi:hydroxypyruvate isomerase